MKKGFTLLELIIVIIIVGVLASLALPKLFSVIEHSRATEALSAIATIRSAMERCYLMNDGAFSDCDWNDIGMDPFNPGPNFHFTYVLTTSDPDPDFFRIVAMRNSRDGGSGLLSDCIGFEQNGSTAVICGAGVFSNLGKCPFPTL